MHVYLIGYLAVANTIGNSAIYAWDVQNQRFDSVWSGPPANELFPVMVTQATGAFVLIPKVDVDPKANCTIFHLIKVTSSDFSPRQVFYFWRKVTFTAANVLIHSF